MRIMKKFHYILSFFGFLFLSVAQTVSGAATTSIKGVLPPKPAADISPAQQAALEKELADVTQAFQVVKNHERAADADIFIKAVRYAIEFHEWYDKKPDDSLKKARALLAEAEKHIEALKKNQTPWMNGTGHKVLGYYSKIDDSPQPYGVEIPDGLAWGAGKKPVPMWIWLHGRGDTATDLPFIEGQMKGKGGPFKPAGTIVVHPFGRYCNGWKSAGEIDVLECKADATARFNVDINRTALAGFSMGGAGAWHLGAHYADQWACVHTGAGFVDVKRYQKLTPDKYPPIYEQKLWGVYDVPDYARNFLNVPLISYSGEIDAQRDSAEYMTEVLAKEGITRPHLIGPGMPHKYHPEVIKEVQKLVQAEVTKGRVPAAEKVSLQTRTLRYPHMKWVQAEGLEKHWEDSRIDAFMDKSSHNVKAVTKNISSFTIIAAPDATALIVDGVNLGAPEKTNTGAAWHGTKVDGTWRTASSSTADNALKKTPGLQGPVDDAFMSSFLVVLPDGKAASPQVQAWVESESARSLKRWRGLMRGDAPVKKASEVTADDISHRNLILWGDEKSNSLVATILPKLQVQWGGGKVGVGTQSFDAATHVPVLCYINPLSPRHYVVLNSGLTFREAHDKTNSLQNPKLPDWAILDITQPPNDESAGRVVAADFFDEHWQVKK